MQRTSLSRHSVATSTSRSRDRTGSGRIATSGNWSCFRVGLLVVESNKVRRISTFQSRLVTDNSPYTVVVAVDPAPITPTYTQIPVLPPAYTAIPTRTPSRTIGRTPTSPLASVQRASRRPPTTPSSNIARTIDPSPRTPNNNPPSPLFVTPPSHPSSPSPSESPLPVPPPSLSGATSVGTPRPSIPSVTSSITGYPTSPTRTTSQHDQSDDPNYNFWDPPPVWDRQQGVYHHPPPPQQRVLSAAERRSAAETRHSCRPIDLTRPASPKPPHPDALRQARFDYDRYCRHVESSQGRLDYWNQSVDEARAQCDQALQLLEGLEAQASHARRHQAEQLGVEDDEDDEDDGENDGEDRRKEVFRG